MSKLFARLTGELEDICRPGFDDDFPEDVLIQMQVEKAIAAGHPLPRWGWGTPRPYNGSSGIERIMGWQKLRIAEQLRLLIPANCCSICRTSGAEHRHAECYFRPLAIKQVCRSCHFRVHRRFFDPPRWRAFVEEHSRPGDWAISLRTIELNRDEAIQIAAAPDIFASLAMR
ncbi:hypothetical protein KK137_00035 [Croceibacterium sp. LX-88]|uniref:Uncharacterized protein n=1 Tax=Croceibacterium selenioxidans TaxID=2838833 RepID=A0ABS5VYU7_9SPHN|nr:hypothetical protein [Croceibacterium selenioxidans]MBT2132707.1 hypothetical protein [Croceibacterium selenioxidans]